MRHHNWGVHDDLIESGRRRLIIVAALGIVMLAVMLALVFFPFAVGVGALSTLLGGSLGYGWKLLGLSFVMAFLFALAIVGAGFAWVFRHAERELLSPMHAFPRPFSGQVTALPPPGAPVGEFKRVRELLDGLSIAAGVLPPSCAVLRDPAPNCLTIGRKPETAWVVVSTGLVETLTRDELEAVLAYEIGRIAVLEVSLDTAVYACTARVFELWAAPFADFGHDSFLLLPFTIITAPLAFGGVLLRRHVLRSRARLSDGLAVRYCRNPAALLSRASPHRRRPSYRPSCIARRRASLAAVPAHEDVDGLLRLAQDPAAADPAARGVDTEIRMTAMDPKPILDLVDIVTGDFESTVAFYQALGVEVEASGGGEHEIWHADVKFPNGASLHIDNIPLAATYNTGLARGREQQRRRGLLRGDP